MQQHRESGLARGRNVPHPANRHQAQTNDGLRSGFTTPPRFSPSSLWSYATRPRWTLDYVFGPKFRLPNLDGYGVLSILSKDPETSHIPFIFLTAKTENSDIRKGMNLGADDYITKPFDETALLDCIEIRLKRSELFHKKFEPNIKGLNEFLDTARGIDELKNYNKTLIRF